jgi:hypothetical protein
VFFSDVTASAPHSRFGSPNARPVAELPSLAATDAIILAANSAVAVMVTAVWAFRTGFEFSVNTVASGGAFPAPSSEDPSTGLHIGVGFSDGRKAASFSLQPDERPSSSRSVVEGVILEITGFGGGRGIRNYSYWVCPLPPQGPVTFACEWRAFGIGEILSDLDAQHILDAAQQSILLWPGTDPQLPDKRA